MEKRVWHDQYDEGLAPSLNYPKVPLYRFLEDTAAKYPGRAAMSFLGKRITYAEFRTAARRFANGLMALGLRKGDRVLLHLPNVPHFPIAYYGALQAGAIVVTANPLYTKREIKHQIDDSGARFVVTLDLKITLGTIKEVLNETKVEKVIVGRVCDYLPFPKSLLYPIFKRGDLTALPPGDKAVRFTSFLAAAPDRPAAVDVSPEDDAVLMYTGGTTGLPKAAVLTHRNVVANAVQTVAWATSGAMDEPEKKVLTVLPLYHSFSMTVCMNASIFRGLCIVLFPTRPKKDLSDLLSVIRDEQPALLPGVPTLYTAMASNPRLGEFKVGCIEVCNSGAAPLPVEVLQDFEAKTGAKIIEGYGLSEACPVVTCNPLKGTRKPGSVGVPVPDTIVRIVNEDTGQDAKTGEPGELRLQGPQVMRGYWNKEKETASTIVDGWLCTGDIAQFDEQGYITIVDRKKDMILTSGFNVYPREVEEVLYEHPKVLEAAVIGVKDERAGERVKAFVVVKEGQTVTEAEILEHCKERLAGYKVPKFIEFRPELPKSNVGKVLRRVLRDEEKEHAKA